MSDGGVTVHLSCMDPIVVQSTQEKASTGQAWGQWPSCPNWKDMKRGLTRTIKEEKRRKEREREREREREMMMIKDGWYFELRINLNMRSGSAWETWGFGRRRQEAVGGGEKVVVDGV